MQPILYYMPEGPPSRALIFLTKYLNLDVEFKLVRTYMDEHMDPAFLKLNPTHTVPVLDDNGFILIDSQAIALYLFEQYGSKTNLYGTNARERALIMQRLFFNSTLFTETKIMLGSIIRGKATSYNEKNLAKIYEMIGFLEIFLKNQDFVAGNYVTIADFFIVNNILTFMHLNFDLSKFKHVLDYVMRMKVLNGFSECEQGAINLAKMILPKLK